MKKELNWKHELARDVIALGSIIFFILVVIRIWLLNDQAYLFQITIAGVLFIILALFFKSSIYSGLALIVLFRTSSYYNDVRYTIFATLAYIGLLYSLIYLNKSKKKILLGIVLGLVSAWVGNFASPYF